MEFAPAKINLSLHVTGKRTDGYHLLDSLVVFVDIGDTVSVRKSNELAMKIVGPEAGMLTEEQDNLVLRAARLFNTASGADLVLEKNLPTSSGIGGGSADAAATLRLLARHWSQELPVSSKILQLGADVPVCLNSKSTRMSGIGEVLSSVPDLPEMALLLANPRRVVSTPAIFKALKNQNNPPMPDILTGTNLGAFCGWLNAQRNDLQAPAISVAQVVNDVLEAISQTGPLLTRMSGSGATCFGIFPDLNKAESAAEALRKCYPEWWIKAGQVLR